MAVAPSPASRPSPTARASHDAVARGVCSYSVDDDGSGWAQHQCCHDEDGGQDDQDDDPDIQDVLGEVGRTCEVREVHPARERQRVGGAATSTPPIAGLTPRCSLHGHPCGQVQLSPWAPLRAFGKGSFNEPQDL